MTIDEAIKHCEEEAEKYLEYGIETECYQCGKEHEQLASWLKELKEAKMLLNLALCDLNNGTCSKFCSTCTKVNTHECQDYKRKNYRWVHTDEALKLLGEFKKDDANCKNRLEQSKK